MPELLLYLCGRLLSLKEESLVKETLELFEDLLLHRRARFEVIRSLHFFQRILFLLIQCFRHINTDVHQQITCTVSIDIRQTFSAQAEHFARLCTRVDLHFHLAVDSRNFHSTTQRSRRETQQQVIDQIIFVAD